MTATTHAQPGDQDLATFVEVRDDYLAGTVSSEEYMTSLCRYLRGTHGRGRSRTAPERWSGNGQAHSLATELPGTVDG